MKKIATVVLLLPFLPVQAIADTSEKEATSAMMETVLPAAVKAILDKEKAEGKTIDTQFGEDMVKGAKAECEESKKPNINCDEVATIMKKAIDQWHKEHP